MIDRRVVTPARINQVDMGKGKGFARRMPSRKASGSHRMVMGLLVGAFLLNGLFD